MAWARVIRGIASIAKLVTPARRAPCWSPPRSAAQGGRSAPGREQAADLLEVGTATWSDDVGAPGTVARRPRPRPPSTAGRGARLPRRRPTRPRRRVLVAASASDYVGDQRHAALSLSRLFRDPDPHSRRAEPTTKRSGGAPTPPARPGARACGWRWRGRAGPGRRSAVHPAAVKRSIRSATSASVPTSEVASATSSGIAS